MATDAEKARKKILILEKKNKIMRRLSISVKNFIYLQIQLRRVSFTDNIFV